MSGCSLTQQEAMTNIHEASRRTLGWLPMALTDGEIGELMDEVEFISSLTDEEYQKYLEETE